MKQTFVTFLFLSLSLQLLWGQEQILPVPSTQPSPAQQKQIARKYGMFIHFGIILFMIRNGQMVRNRLPLTGQQPSMQTSGSGWQKMLE